MTRQTLDILVRARNLLAIEDRWTQGASARTSERRETSPRSGSAVAFSLGGAIEHVGTSPGDVRRDFIATAEALDIIDRVTGGDVEEFNDRVSHADILAALDCAIVVVQA